MNGTCDEVKREKSRVTFDQVEKYHADNYVIWKALLDTVEGLAIEARDKEAIPIYSTKYRIKSPESIYLKTKRTEKSLAEIQDYSGLRILCLFEEDIIKINDKLLSIFERVGLVLEMYKVYNFDDQVLISNLKKSISQYIPEQDVFKPKRKLSGYKSIHYIGYQLQGLRKVYIEVQLRTLLQDVWGELEHALSYKRGMIHPHIVKSFKLLARDLGTSDMLMSHLRDINKKEATKDRYGVRKIGLRHYFKYDEGCYPTQLEDSSVEPLCKEYEKIMEDIVRNKHEAGAGALESAKEKFRELRRQVNKLFPDQMSEDVNLRYWFAMEESLLLSLENKYDRALEKYKSLLSDFSEKYILHFRIGEMHFILGHIADALRSFDRSEIVLQSAIVNDAKSQIKCRNLVTIKRKLAYTFWILGDQYIGRSLRLTKDIEGILAKRGDAFVDDDERLAMYNNMCWYTTQDWQLAIKELDCCDEDKEENTRANIVKKKEVAKSWYERLSAAIVENRKSDIEVPSNWLDTVAYYCYREYLDTRDPSYRDLAQRYATECDHGTNYATLSLTSLSIHINHITEIMSLG